jgi:transcriptional regulator with XRE-family HTH domain
LEITIGCFTVGWYSKIITKSDLYSRKLLEVAERSPTLRRRELASRLRELRKQAGLTVEDVARELLCSPPKISRIETGTRGASLRDVRDLCRLYRVSDSEQARLMTIAREAKQQGWWNKFDDLGIESLIGLETEAKRISGHDASVVPWAFQTEQYARAVIKGVLPRMDDRILDERVTARMIRQEILGSPEPPYLWSLIDESALHRAIGGNGVMREQFDKILEVAAASNVTVQVVPFEAGAQPGLDNTFMLLEFDSSVQSPVVFVENLAGYLYLERDAEIERYREALEHMRACALSPANSVKYIEKIRKALEELSSSLRSIIAHLSERKFAMSNFEGSLQDIPWRKAVKSSTGGCVQVRRRDGVIMVADSKNPGGPVLSYTLKEWDAFLDGAKKGEFDDFLN